MNNQLSHPYTEFALYTYLAVFMLYGLLPCLMEYRPLLPNLPQLILSLALLFAALTAHSRNEGALFCVFITVGFIAVACI